MTLHAHVSTAARDCDGLYTRDYVMTFDEAETVLEKSLMPSAFHFMNRVMCAVASPYAVEHGMTVRVDDAGIEVHEVTDEGYSEASVRWCHDDDCELGEWSFRDHTAEAAGY